MDKDGFWAVDLFPVFLQTQGENPKNQWSAAPLMVTVISLAELPVTTWPNRPLEISGSGDGGEWG